MNIIWLLTLLCMDYHAVIPSFEIFYFKICKQQNPPFFCAALPVASRWGHRLRHTPQHAVSPSHPTFPGAAVCSQLLLSPPAPGDADLLSVRGAASPSLLAAETPTVQSPRPPQRHAAGSRRGVVRARRSFASLPKSVPLWA